MAETVFSKGDPVLTAAQLDVLLRMVERTAKEAALAVWKIEALADTLSAGSATDGGFSMEYVSDLFYGVAERIDSLSDKFADAIGVLTWQGQVSRNRAAFETKGETSDG